MIYLERMIDEDDRLYFLFRKQLERVNYWLSYAETKNAAMIALNVAICGQERMQQQLNEFCNLFLNKD